MNDFNSLRPEDFQKTWVNAYARSVRHLGVMFRRADLQIAISQRLIDISSKNTEESRVRLLKTATVFLGKIEGANDLSNAKLTAATAKLNEATRMLIDDELKRRVKMEKLLVQIERERHQFSRMKAEFRNLPWWKRLWYFPNTD